MKRLENWAIYGDVYDDPKMGMYMLAGDVYEDPKRPDGTRIQTTRVVKVDGRIIATQSGSIYRLGEVESGYRDYLRRHRPKWDPENPVTIT